jgi:pimeloyl-ACP methyl ester carboxylesterase
MTASTPRSTSGGDQILPRRRVRFYEEVRQVLALPKVVVLGHSFGANACWPLPRRPRWSR